MNIIESSRNLKLKFTSDVDFQIWSLVTGVIVIHH